MDIRNSQNFLHSKKLVKRLVDESNLNKEDIVYEIGPGKGIITAELANCCKEIHAIELDKELYDKLKDRFKENSNIFLYNKDFLKMRLPNFDYKIFSNIPFNLTADILTKLLTNDNSPKDMYIIMQYEAILKYAGYPYYSDSLKSLMFKPIYEIKIVHEFEMSDFTPKPNVAIDMAHFHKKEYCDIKNASIKEYWDFLTYVYSAKGQSFKEKTKKVFSYEQQKRLRKGLGIRDEDHISCWTYKQWLGLFDCYNKLVCKEKKALVIGAYKRLLAEQSKIDKIHRNRTSRL